MKKFARVFLTTILGGCLIASVALAPAYAAAAITLLDDSGATITLKNLPQRIVSITPGTTEMLFAVGAGDRVVGDTTACDYPAAAKSLKIAKIGSYIPNYEKIIALRPDLVIVDDIAEHAAAARLRSLHQTVLVIRPSSISAIESDLRLIGRATGATPRAEDAVAQMESKVRRAAALARKGSHPRVLALVGVDPLWVAGGGTFSGDVIVRAGGVNVAENLRGFVQFSDEAFLSRAPEVILAGPTDCRAVAAIPAFRAVPAVRRHRFISIDSNLLERPGPRLADGVLQLAQALARQ